MGLALGRARIGAAAVAVAVLCAACSPSAPADPASGEPGTTPVSGSPIGDSAHAVPAPGPLKSPLYGDDLLIVSAATIDDALLKKITGVRVKGRKGVAAYNRLTYGNFSVQNKLFNIAAVDPASYRAFTGARSANFQQQWDRLAGGEVLIADKLQKQMPVGADDYLGVGNERIHVGAWSPADVDSVDVMVNERWGQQLGLTQHNAVLLNTGPTSPQAVREQLDKLLGKGTVSITALDIVAQTGIDPDTFQNVIPVGTFRDAVGVYRYRPTGGGHIAPDPAWVREHITSEVVPILGRVTCNKAIFPQLKAALGEIVHRGLADQIHPGEYAGCYYPRFIAGSTTLSNHAFGLALDLNTPGNQRGTVGQMNREVVAIFKLWGFAWGGDWAWTDPMHFELAEIRHPG